MNMNKKLLKETQPVVYKTLSNALTKDHLAHAYLFEGDKSAPKKETALLFAQSLVCQHKDEDGFACQECDACKRIEHGEAIDYKWIDGTKNRIKKNDVLKIQELFETTSAEIEDRRIYVLEGFDDATVDASNSLLKFLEEPAPGIFGILIADEKSNILPTIQSRCQWIHFRPASRMDVVNKLIEKCDQDTAQMLANSGYTYNKACELLEYEEFSIIRQAAKDYVKNMGSMNEIFSLQSEVFIAKGSLMKKEWIRIWIQWVLYELKKDGNNLSLAKRVKIQTILVEAMDILRRPVDLALFLDKIYFDIKKVVKSLN